jgi:putative transposase
MYEHQKEFNIMVMCEVFDVSSAGYYAWISRPESERKQQDRELKESIATIYEKCKGRCGYRPMYGHLQDAEVSCGRDRTLRLMREEGLEHKPMKKFKPQMTNSNHSYGYSPNLLKKRDHPVRCDEVWVTDTTYIQTQEGWLYLATAMDLFSRRIVGWSMSASNDTQLVCDALNAAIKKRGTGSAIHHSDRGSTYASHQYMKLLKSNNIESSMSAKGNCYDNAFMESFFGRFKYEEVCGQIYSTRSEAKSSAFDYIECYYNRFRKHSSLGYKSPAQFEELSQLVLEKVITPELNSKSRKRNSSDRSETKACIHIDLHWKK